MLAAFAALLLAAQASGLRLAVGTQLRDHPAVKVITLLTTLQAQVKEEGAAEAAEYSKFVYWCKELTSKKVSEIAESTARIEATTARIAALTADIAALDADVAELTTQIAAGEAAAADLTATRTSANGKYVSAKTDAEETISALDAAITNMKGSGFLQQPFEDRTGGKPTYDFKSGGVIETFKGLHEKFSADLLALNQAETASVSAHELALAAKQNEVAVATAAKAAKEDLSSRKGQDKATATSEQTEATGEKDTATGVLDATKERCATRADQWADRSHRREGEVAAMKEAVEILEKVTGVRSPEEKGVTLLQLQDPALAKVVNLLRTVARKHKAAGLTDLVKLADKIAGLSSRQAGLLKEVEHMIEKMVSHLLAEQKKEDDHKNWCDLELKKTNELLDEKETSRDALAAEVNALSQEIAQLEEDIQENTVTISELSSEQESQETARSEELAENTATIKDAQKAQAAVEQALAVLQDFYKNTGGIPKESWEVLVQGGDEPEPQPFGESAYEGTSGGTGVVDLLGDVAADFASMEAEAKSDEVSQQSAFDQWIATAKAETNSRKKDTAMKEARLTRQNGKLQARQEDAGHNTKELEAANEYHGKLQPACVEGDSTYADRRGARTDEIAALQQAEGILQNALRF